MRTNVAIVDRLMRSAAVKCGFAVVMALCALAPLGMRVPAASAEARAHGELPQSWDGKPLRPLALSRVEARFAARFPGTIARMTDGQGTLVLRRVHTATRMLHPATDCYRGLGYAISQQVLEQDGEQRLWRCFVALRGGERVRVCERIVDARGQAFTDTSAWFWAASLGQSSGPWQAVTTARPL
jgi:hypothetical protein